MNLQAPIAGQYSRQVSNQGGASLPAIPQQQNMMQNSEGGPRAPVTMEQARQFIRDRIYKFLTQRLTREMPPKNYLDIVRRLEEGLFKSAQSKEEYLNLDTLENRLQALLKRNSMNNQNQRYQQQSNANASMGTMIPTPGFPQNGNSGNMMSSVVNQGSFSMTTPGPSRSMHTGSFDGGLSDGSQQAMSNFSLTGGQRIGSQMMPTPGLNNSNNINSASNQSYVKLEPTNNVSVISNADSAMVSQPLQQKQQVGGQNSRILHSLGSHMGGGIRSTLTQKSYGFPNGSVNSNLGMMGKSSPMVNSLGNSEGYLTDSHYGNSPKLVSQYFDQHQGQISQGDGSGNLFVPTTSSTSLMNMNPNLSTLQRTNSPLVVNQSNLHNSDQPANIKPSIDQSYAQPSDQQQLIQSQRQQNQQNQWLPYGQSQLISDMGNRIKSEPQAYEHFQSSRGSQLHAISSGSQDMSSSMQQTSVQQQQIGGQGQPPQGQWHSRLHEPSNHLGNSSNEMKTEEGFQDQIQRNSLSSEASMAANASADLPSGRELQFKNQQRWLLLMLHARKCGYPPGKCPERYCIVVQKLWKHIMSHSDVTQCQYPRCHRSTTLLHHHKQCKDESCPVCVPVKLFVQQKGVRQTSFPQTGNGSHDYTSEDLHPSIKRLKIEQSPAAQNQDQSENENRNQDQNPNPIIPVSISATSERLPEPETRHPLKYDVAGVKQEVPTSSMQGTMKITKENNDGVSLLSNEGTGFPKQEFFKAEKEVGPTKQDDVALVAETSAAGTKSGKPKIKGVSMIELFTPEQVQEHITGLRQWVGQSKAKVEKNQAMEHLMNENSCQLCAVEKLNFEPPPTYCSPCGARIKRNAMFYTWGSGETRHFFCIPCYNESRGDTISVDGTNILKARLEKKKNDEETEEPWVQCDKCEAWQHQICALFNGRRDDGGQAEYTCPNCYVEEVERGERVPLPQSALLGAKDLPRTILSDHIENRLFKRLKQERSDRARFQGKSYDEVPGAESLVVRVVSSVDKKLEVKPRFLEIFQEENYPSEFAYKSKVVLLFQRIEGVEVCLFGMYVQEFGAECEQPNHRRVYLSYLDSVKYFRPEIRTVTGEALRTFVYHEILIGYLEYCKLRGFTSCYIWACPPLKGEDYILYCHPEIQKTPKSDKLREWYLSMLRKATKENIVVDLTNLYDHFFVQSGECKAKVTASRLPYFDGDYWPGAAEDIIYEIRQEEEGRKHNRKGPMKRTITKRALKASGQTDLSSNASKDLLLMHRLGETISPMKEDFIMVHLQHPCTHCCILMVSGTRWVCNNCKNFQLCTSCYEIEQTREERERHPINQRIKHQLYPMEINDVPTDTKDRDEILESEFFDTRQAFLNLCQGNHYQYDTLRRAKHSSMMALYHLHNPTAPAFVINCIICRLDIETGQGWRCEICPDYDICNSCYLKGRGRDHPHKLTHHPSIAERDAQNTEARQQRVLQLRKMLDLLVHASQCKSGQCQYPNCRKVKGLFRHGMQCKIRASGGCLLCKKMWDLLQLHARSCKDSPCTVPRCRDLREHLRRLTQQADSRRRAAVMEMMRQRAAEVASSS
ncbi:putative histone acetyltransferase chromatin regulator PHD family [Helianthus annuus]|uniref:histone acetyltransferase n=3 Tax=Helianthus annuus TaxID=4232 RepID=A0A251UQV8_HELAN|nr:histone acetyltransferase HAC1 [Helianthus annuus]XP_022038692.1 histone acetyltransferase HAC1 [Helianthus annuus]KAF5806420.1 putative histone acetyltransferase chromatin regulator PHD family [Helianthus annuus]KAJ0570691.1 putative histone acetyltransferase chromatin regulator PHD family [Helianthus annuus]KAJ0577609.1 putative histone acetyltransferase chromatin regulator PHD family [Helianthus annuus]KAJ0585034.1 putative histone acetyltransferase chromatin regulator PHD family [Helian